MLGCRPLSEEEINSILSNLNNRDKTLFLLGLKTGFRVSELLSLKVKDVFQYGHMLDRITVARKNMKGSRKSRTVMLHAVAKNAVSSLIALECLTSDDFLFQSGKGINCAISRIQAHRVIKDAVIAANITGKVATHSWRKTFAKHMNEKFDGNLLLLQAAMGHDNISSTVRYLSFDQETVDKAILE